MEGQVFVTTAIVISGIMMIALVPAGPTVFDQSDINFYFQSSFQQLPESFNEGLANNRSTEAVKREVYSYLDATESRTGPRGIEFESYVLGVFPQRGEAFLINFREEPLNYEFEAEGLDVSGTVEPLQFEQFSLDAGNQQFDFNASDQEYRFVAAQPKTVRWMAMETEGERWENSEVG